MPGKDSEEHPAGPRAGWHSAGAWQRTKDGFAALAQRHASALVRLTALVAAAEQRACWVLRELDGRSCEFIADAVGMGQEAVEPATSLHAAA